jgi:hypothetical protein
MPAASPAGRDAHLDAMLTNLTVAAFAATAEQQGFIAQDIFPVATVPKQSNKYYVIDPDSWLRIADTRRSPKARPNRIEFKVSSDAYFADNYALAGDIAKEDLANADMALNLRENTAQITLQGLLQDLEVRVANMVTSVSNVGSGVAVASKWSDLTNSNPMVDIQTAHAFIRRNTGLVANTLVMDEDSFQALRRNSKLLELYKYTSGGLVADEAIARALGVERILHGRAIRNNAVENATGSYTNIWGNNALLCYVAPGATGLMTATFGLQIRWVPEGISAPFAVFRYDDPDPGKKIEVVEASYYQDERIVARNLGYVLTATL